MADGVPAQGQQPDASTATELQPAASAAPVDGGAAPGDQQNVDAPQESDAERAAREEQEKQTKNRERFDKRFSDLTKREREAREEAAYWRGVAETRGQPPRQEPAPVQPTQDADPKPVPANFGGEFSNEYLEALASWNGREAVRQHVATTEAANAEKAKRDAVEAAQQEGEKRWRDVKQQAAELKFDGGAKMLDRLPIEVVDDITKRRNPAHLAEWLSRNPDFANELPHMEREERLEALWDLDRQIGAILADAKKKRDAQNAQPPASTPAPKPSPAPTTTVNGHGAAPNFNPETAAFDEFEAHAKRVWSGGQAS